MQHVAFRPQPVGPDHLRDVRRQGLHGHDCAPSHNPGKFGTVGAEQALANFRVNAVRANHVRCAHGGAGLKRISACPSD